MNQILEFKMYIACSGKLVVTQHFADFSLKESEGPYQSFASGDLQSQER